MFKSTGCSNIGPRSYSQYHWHWLTTLCASVIGNLTHSSDLHRNLAWCIDKHAGKSLLHIKTKNNKMACPLLGVFVCVPKTHTWCCQSSLSQGRSPLPKSQSAGFLLVFPALWHFCLCCLLLISSACEHFWSVINSRNSSIYWVWVWVCHGTRVEVGSDFQKLGWGS